MKNKKGDKCIISNLLEKNQKNIYIVIRRRIVNVFDAEDVLQKTNLRLMDNANRYDKSRPFLPWALSIARYEILSFFRDRERDRCILDENLEQRIQLVIEENFFSDDKLEEIEALHFCFFKLKYEYQVVLIQRYISGDSIHAIAQYNGRSENSIRGILMRAKKHLRKEIESRLLISKYKV